MRKRSSALSRITASAKRMRLLRKAEDPEIKAERLKKLAEGMKVKRSAETPEQRESRLGHSRIRANKRRAQQLAALDSKRRNTVIEALKNNNDKRNTNTLIQQEADEIRQIEDAERHLVRGFREVTKLEKLSRTRSNSNDEDDTDESAMLETVVDLCVVELTSET